MTDLFLLRHAPVQLPAGICYGHLDVAIDRLRAHDLAADCLATLPAPVSVICSDRARSHQTLSILEMHGLQRHGGISITASLAEQRMGAFEGRSYDRLADDLGADYWVFWDDPVHNATPDGESFALMAHRVWHFMAHMRDDISAPLLVICHAGPIRALMAAYEAQPLSEALGREVIHMQPYRLERARLMAACTSAFANA